MSVLDPDDGVEPGRGGRAVEHRRRLMFDQIVRTGSAQVEELATRFGVSRMTVHRDLDAMAELHMVRKQHGGVTLHESCSVESSFAHRLHLAQAEKEMIARAAAAMVQPGQVVIMDESTTTLRMVPHMAGSTPLTVITNGLAMIDRLKDLQGFRLIGLGGTHNARLNAFFGLVCEATIANLRANLLFMSAPAVSGGAVYHQDDEVLSVKRAMMASADRKVLLLDSSKFAVTALNRLAPLNAFDHVITDNRVPMAERALLQEQKVDLRIVDP